MGKQLYKLSPPLIRFIETQRLFFVATAMDEGKINLSPKGLDTFKVLNENKALWLNLTGSGNETAVHLKEDGRITIMFCSFEGKPLILRLYGRAKTHHRATEFWNKHISLFPKIAGGRQLIEVEIDLVQTSCGMGVPLYDYRQQRHELVSWAEKKGDNGLEKYWAERNSKSIDGFDSGILD
ncbi:MAG: pyridoxamine 5'-phosphate oxidase family protein [Maribacter sp.]